MAHFKWAKNDSERQKTSQWKIPELKKPENSVLATQSKTVPTFRNNNEFIPPVSREGTVYDFIM